MTAPELSAEERAVVARCGLLIAPFTTCGEPVFEDSERCATHYVRFLEELARRLVRELDESRAAVRAGLALVGELAELGDLNMTRADEHQAAGRGEESNYRAGRSISYMQSATKLRAALTAALAGQHTTDDARLVRIGQLADRLGKEGLTDEQITAVLLITRPDLMQAGQHTTDEAADRG